MIQNILKEKIILLQQVEALVNDLKGAKYSMEEKDCLLKYLNESINDNKVERKKYKEQVHGVKDFFRPDEVCISKRDANKSV